MPSRVTMALHWFHLYLNLSSFRAGNAAVNEFMGWRSWDCPCSASDGGGLPGALHLPKQGRHQRAAQSGAPLPPAPLLPPVLYFLFFYFDNCCKYSKFGRIILPWGGLNKIWMFTLSVHRMFIEHMTCATWVNLNILFCVKTATVFRPSPMRLLSGGLLCPSQSSGALEGSARRQEVPLRGTIEKWPRAQGTWPDYATWWTTLSSSGRSILPRIVSNLSNRSFRSDDLITDFYNNKMKYLDKAKTSGCIILMCELLLDHHWCNILPKNSLMRPWPPSSPQWPHVIFATTVFAVSASPSICQVQRRNSSMRVNSSIQ